MGAALAASVPPGVTRTVYLCDDGKDPKKAALVASLGPACRCAPQGFFFQQALRGAPRRRGTAAARPPPSESMQCLCGRVHAHHTLHAAT